MRKDVPNYWKNKFIQLIEKHGGLTEKMAELKNSLNKKSKPSSGAGKRRGK